LFEEEFDIDFLSKILKQLNPFNCILVYSSSDELQNSITEKYLGGKYIVDQLPERRVVVGNFESLVKNPFLPVDTKVKEVNADKETPRKIAENVLFLKDNNFKVCKGGIRVTLHGLKEPTLREFYA
jgi:hypothetical protein